MFGRRAPATEYLWSRSLTQNTNYRLDVFLIGILRLDLRTPREPMFGQERMASLPEIETGQKGQSSQKEPRAWYPRWGKLRQPRPCYSSVSKFYWHSAVREEMSEPGHILHNRPPQDIQMRRIGTHKFRVTAKEE